MQPKARNECTSQGGLRHGASAAVAAAGSWPVNSGGQRPLPAALRHAPPQAPGPALSHPALPCVLLPRPWSPHWRPRPSAPASLPATRQRASACRPGRHRVGRHPVPQPQVLAKALGGEGGAGPWRRGQQRVPWAPWWAASTLLLPPSRRDIAKCPTRCQCGCCSCSIPIASSPLTPVTGAAGCDVARDLVPYARPANPRHRCTTPCARSTACAALTGCGAGGSARGRGEWTWPGPA